MKHRTPREGNHERASSTSRRKRRALLAASGLAVALVGAGAVFAVANPGSLSNAVDRGLGVQVASGNEENAPGQSGETPGNGSGRPTTNPADPQGTPPNPPGGGNPDPPAFWEPQPIAEAVEFDVEAAFVEALAAEVTLLEAVQGIARGPGEIAGPAVRITVKIANETSNAVDLDDAIVALYYGTNDDPAIQLSSPGARPLDGELEPGATTVGVYVFAVPVENRDQVRITVSYSPQDRAVAFEGAAPKA